MFCRKCGTKLPDGSKFCYNCGAEVNIDVIDETPANVNAPADIKNTHTVKCISVNDLPSLLEDIKDVDTRAEEPIFEFSPDQYVEQAKQILEKKVRDGKPVSQKAETIILEYVRKYAENLLGELQEELKQQNEAAKEIKKHRDGLYAFLAGSVEASLANMGDHSHDNRMAINAYRATSIFSDIFTGLAYVSMSQIYWDQYNESGEKDKEAYQQYDQWRSRSLAIFKNIAITQQGLRQGLSIERLCYYYSEFGDDDKANLLAHLALDILSQAYKSKDKYAFIAAEHIAGLYYNNFHDSSKTQKWLRLAENDLRAVMNKKASGKEDEEYSLLIKYEYARFEELKNNIDSATEAFENLGKIFSKFVQLCNTADSNGIQALIKEFNSDMNEVILGLTGDYANELIDGQNLDIHGHSVYFPPLTTFWLEIKAPFMKLANTKYMEFLAYYKMNVHSLDDVFSKALAEACTMTDDAISMGIDFAQRYGVTISKDDVKKNIVANWQSSNLPSLDFRMLKTISVALNQILEEAGVKRDQDAEKDYSLLDMPPLAFGIGGLIGSFATTLLVNAGTNLLAVIGRSLMGNSAAQILHRKMHRLYTAFPAIGLWMANIIFQYHEEVFNYVCGILQSKYHLPPDEEPDEKSKWLDRTKFNALSQWDKVQYYCDKVTSHSPLEMITNTVADRLIDNLLAIYREDHYCLNDASKVVDFLGLNAYFAAKYYCDKNNINIYNIYKGTVEDKTFDCYSIVGSTLKELHLAPVPTTSFNKNTDNHSIIFTRDDIPTDFYGKEFSIPDGYTEIGEQAFSYCSNLESVIVPKSVKKVGKKAFSNCTNLLDVLFPNRDYDIGEDVFSETPHVVVESVENGSWDKYCNETEDLSKFMRDPDPNGAEVLVHYSEFVPLGKNPYRRNYWKFKAEGLFGGSHAEIKAVRENLTVKESYSDNPVTFSARAITDVKVKTAKLEIEYVDDDGSEHEEDILTDGKVWDYRKFHSFLKYVEHYNWRLEASASEMLEDEGYQDDSAELEEPHVTHQETSDSCKLVQRNSDQTTVKDGISAFDSGDYAAALGLLLRDYNSNNNDVKAQAALYLGVMCANGLGVQVDINKAKAWFETAKLYGSQSIQENADAWLKRIQSISDGSSKKTPESTGTIPGEESFNEGNYAQALPVLQKVYSNGGIQAGKAALLIGIMCANGLGVEVNRPNAIAWFDMSIQLGDNHTKKIANDWKKRTNA